MWNTVDRVRVVCVCAGLAPSAATRLALLATAVDNTQENASRKALTTSVSDVASRAEGEALVVQRVGSPAPRGAAPVASRRPRRLGLPRHCQRGVRELTDDRAELSARLGIHEPELVVERVLSGRDGEVVVEHGCTGGPQDLAKLGLCPARRRSRCSRRRRLRACRGARCPGRAARPSRWRSSLPRHGGVVLGRGEQQASASAIAARRTATAWGAGSTSSSSEYGGTAMSASSTTTRAAGVRARRRRAGARC